MSGMRAAERARAAAISAGAALLVFGVGLLAWRSGPLIALVLLAVLIAVPLRRAVTWIVAIGLRRGLAAALVIVAALAALLALGFAVLRPAALQGAELVAAIPSLLDGLRRSARAAEVVRWLGGDPAIAKIQEAVPAIAQGALGGAASAASGVAGFVGSAGTILAATLLFVAVRESPLEAAARLAPPSQRARWYAVAERVEDGVAGYLIGLAAIVAIRASVSTAVLALLGFPFYLPLALLAAATVLVPYLGAVVRFAVLVPVALATGGPVLSAAVLAFLLVYDALENGLLSPLVYRRTMDLSPLVQFLAVLFLGYHGGLGFAMLALPLAAAIQTIFTEARKSPAATLPATSRDAPAAAPGPDPGAR
jgi:putative heme transporter